MSNLTNTIQKLHSFRKLKDGWRFGNGGAPSEKLIEKAEKYLRHASKLGLDITNVFTGSEREIVLEFYENEDSIEITFEVDGTITFAEDKNNKQVDFVENITEANLYKRIWQFQFPNGSFAPSIRETTMRKAARSTALHLSLRATVAVSQSSKETALVQRVEQSANTFNDSTQTKPSLPAFTGSFPLTLCQTDA